MSQKRNHRPNTRKSMCDKCGVEEVSVQGRRHRRCSGQADLPIRTKYDLIPVADRGKWS